MDGCSREQFESKFSVALVDIDAVSLLKQLAHGSTRPRRRFSGIYKKKTLWLIAHLERGGLVSPPFIKYGSHGFTIDGGNHRFWWSRHIRQSRIPVLILRDSVPEALNLLQGALVEPCGTLESSNCSGCHL
jgi:hypothetical protein